MASAHQKGKKTTKPNVTEDKAARMGMARREGRAEDNKHTKWVWDRLMCTQSVTHAKSSSCKRVPEDKQR